MIFERARFNRRNQLDSESAEQYIIEYNRAIRSYCYVMLEIKIETCTIFFLGYGALKYDKL